MIYINPSRSELLRNVYKKSIRKLSEYSNTGPNAFNSFRHSVTPNSWSDLILNYLSCPVCQAILFERLEGVEFHPIFHFYVNIRFEKAVMQLAYLACGSTLFDMNQALE